MEKVPFYKTTWFTVLALVLCFPVGVILMWVNKKFPTTIRIVITVLALILCIAVTPSEEEKARQKAEAQEKRDKQAVEVAKAKKEREEKAEEEAQKKKEAEKAKTTKEKVEDVVSKEIDKKRILEVSTNSWYESGEKTKYEGANITIQGRERITNSSIRFEMLEDTKKIASKIFKVDKVGSILIMFKYPMQDVKGNESNDVILKVSLTRDNAKDINWDNFNSENFSKVADTYYEHPALSK
ncbi:hypothetical protein MMJ09_04100 [Bacillus vallismortis]|nr:hypothetical protein [Bacillus vallismortis]